jgi:capsular polysaccharide biosynthesis protein
MLLNTLVSIVVGGVLGIAAVLGIEHMDHRIRNSSDLVDLTGVRVLAEIPRRRRRERRRRLLPSPQRPLSLTAK